MQHLLSMLLGKPGTFMNHTLVRSLVLFVFVVIILFCELEFVFNEIVKLTSFSFKECSGDPLLVFGYDVGDSCSPIDCDYYGGLEVKCNTEVDIPSGGYNAYLFA